MLKAHRITTENIGQIEALYGRFCAVVKTRYRWAHDAVEFSILKQAIAGGFVRGYWVEDTGLQKQIALMLFTKEEHRAIEINAIHIEDSEHGHTPLHKSILDCLMRRFIQDIQNDPAFLDSIDVVSYPMLGDQEILIRSIIWYGFKPVGQAIAKFDIMDPISLQILKQQKLGDLPEGYRMDQYRAQYAGALAKVVHESFSKASDAKWDPRFRTEAGARKVMGMLAYGMMGDLCEESTSVLLKNDVPVGVCFLIQPVMTEGNIPLVGVLPSEKKQGFGNHLLQRTLATTVQAILDGKLGMLSVNATHDTDNLAAIKMYRRMGFREDYNYPHVYLTTEKLRQFQFGKWC